MSVSFGGDGLYIFKTKLLGGIKEFFIIPTIY